MVCKESDSRLHQLLYNRFRYIEVILVVPVISKAMSFLFLSDEVVVSVQGHHEQSKRPERLGQQS